MAVGCSLVRIQFKVKCFSVLFVLVHKYSDQQHKITDKIYFSDVLKSLTRLFCKSD